MGERRKLEKEGEIRKREERIDQEREMNLCILSYLAYLRNSICKFIDSINLLFLL